VARRGEGRWAARLIDENRYGAAEFGQLGDQGRRDDRPDARPLLEVGDVGGDLAVFRDARRHLRLDPCDLSVQAGVRRRIDRATRRSGA
jgi:hypothetical protein